MTGRRPRVYAAHPMTSYGTEHEQRCLDAIAAAFPGVEIVNPAGRYATNAGWLRGWPRLLPTLSAVVLFADDGGCVGVGCMREITDAIRLRVPVYVLDGRLRLRELARLVLLAPDERSARRAAQPVAGPVVPSVREAT